MTYAAYRCLLLDIILVLAAIVCMIVLWATLGYAVVEYYAPKSLPFPCPKDRICI